MLQIILHGEPKTTNHLYRFTTRGVYMTKDGRYLKTSYQWQCKKACKGMKPIEGDIEVIIRMYFKHKLKRDWDNFHKISMDACNGFAWSDDSQIVKATVFKLYDKEDPRIEVDVIPMV